MPSQEYALLPNVYKVAESREDLASIVQSDLFDFKYDFVDCANARLDVDHDNDHLLKMSIPTLFEKRPVTNLALERLCVLSGVPFHFGRKIPSDLLQTNLNRLLDHNPIFVVTRKHNQGEVVGAMKVLPKFGIKDLAEEALTGIKGDFKRALVSDTDIRLTTVQPELSYDVVPTDTVWPGVTLKASQTNGVDPRVHLSLFRLVCWNGATIEHSLFSMRLPNRWQGSPREGAKKLVELSRELAEVKLPDLLIPLKRMAEANTRVVPASRLWHAVASRLGTVSADEAFEFSVDQRKEMLSKSRDAGKLHDRMGPELDPTQTWWTLMNRTTKYAREKAGEHQGHLETFAGSWLLDALPSLN